MGERRQDSGQDVPRSAEKVDGWLRAARGPALIIAPGEASLVAANPAGAKLLGLGDVLGQAAIPLDSAMPAIMDLRRAVNRGARGREPATHLVFWTANGIARLRCFVEMTEDDGGQRLVLVEVASDTELASDLGPSTTSRTAAVDDPVAPFVVQDDQVAEVVDRTEAVAEPIVTNHAPEAVAAPYSELPQSSASRAAPTSLAAVEHSEKHAPEPLPRAPALAPEERGHARPSKPPHTITAPPHLPHHAPPLPAPPPAARSDADTLKAIARQILAGRRSASKSTDGIAHTPGDAPEKPNGTATQKTHSTSRPSQSAPPMPAAATTRTRPATAQFVNAAPASMAAAKPSTSKDVRRSDFDAARAAPETKAEATSTDAMPVRPDDETDRTGLARPTRARRVAHELKTPLSAIASAAEIMKDQRLGSIGDDRYLRYAQDIYESARHALDVIERMLGQPRKDAKSSDDRELSFTNLDINALAAGLVSGLETMALQAGLTLTSELAPRLPLVVADATSVRQIVLNIITNALKFTPRGGQVRLATHVDEDGQLILSVSDTGPGMSAEDLALFADDTEALAHEGAHQQRPGGGLGIGLPLSRKLASANGARLGISKSENGGTLVTLAFPSNRQVPI